MAEKLQFILVEDDSDDAQLFAECFQPSGHHLKIITGGDQVLPYISALNKLPDMIVLDINLPKKNGVEILTELKAHQWFSLIPVVVLTTSDFQRNDCLKLKALKYYIKPMSLQEMQQIVDEIVQLATSGKRLS
ncbi:MAG: response regulator [Chitinophagales bacterium]